MRYLGIALSCALALSSAQAAVYRYVDAEGNTVFTDQPPLDVEASEYRPVQPNSSVAPAPARPTGERETRSVTPAQPYQVLELSGIPDEEALRANNGTFSLQVYSQPAVRPTHRLQLLVDGQPYGSPTAGTQIQVQNLERGTHLLAVQVLAGNRVLQTSSEQSIHIQRIHVNSPARR